MQATYEQSYLHLLKTSCIKIDNQKLSILKNSNFILLYADIFNCDFKYFFNFMLSKLKTIVRTQQYL